MLGSEIIFALVCSTVARCKSGFKQERHVFLSWGFGFTSIEIYKSFEYLQKCA